MKTRRVFRIILSFVLICTMFCTAAYADADTAAERKNTYEGKTVGILTGTIHDIYSQEYFPGAKLSYFSSVGDMVAALKSGSIDMFGSDIFTVFSLMAEDPRFTYLDEALDSFPLAYAFPKSDAGSALCAEMSEFITKLDNSGALEELQNKWLIPDSPDYSIDMSGLDKNGKTLVLATSCQSKPSTYIYNGQPTGYEIEMAVLFCREYGYALDIQITDFAGIIPGLVTGRYDFAAECIAVTEERAQSVNFSVPHYYGPAVAVVLRDTAADADRKFTCVADLNDPDIKVGTLIGSAWERYCQTCTPRAQIDYYNSSTDLLFALSKGLIDAIPIDETMARYFVAKNDDMELIEEPMEPISEFGMIVGNTDFDTTLLSQLNEFIEKHRSDGLIDEIIKGWCADENRQMGRQLPAEGENGVIKVGVAADNPPVVFVRTGEIVGFDIEILLNFCEEYGYGIELEDTSIASMIPGAVSGRYNIVTSTLTITPERAEQARFTVPYLTCGGLALIRKPVEEKGFFDKLADSFERTFIREQRWKLIVEGIGVTVLISLCATLLGTVLGFGLCLLRRTKNRFAHGFTSVYIRILQGTPILVFLMILYYIVFAGTGVSGELVAIIAFGLNFAAYSCEIFRSGIDGVDKGQMEAALAIGYTRPQAFLRIVLPQAAQSFLPIYKGEFISLVKMTSIVGYIAVQDLTKMSDIIRSRTYEAFFPLIATAVIYFVLSALLTGLLKMIEIRIKPNRKNRALKGVNMK